MNTTNDKNDRADYYRVRNLRNITFKVDSLDLKNRIKEAAKKDNRSVQSWVDHYLVCVIEKLVDDQIGPAKKKK